MSRYINNNSSATVTEAGIVAGKMGNVVTLHGRAGDGPEALQDLLREKFKDLTVVTAASFQGRPMVVASGAVSEEALISGLRDAGGEFKKEEVKKEPPKKEFSIFGMKLGLMQVRGILGNIGQIFALIGSKKEVNLGFTKIRPPKPNEDKGAGTMYSIVANAISMVFGSQKKEDTPREKFVKQHINQGLAMELGPEIKLPLPHQKQLALRHDLPPKTFVDSAKDLFLGNTMRISQFLKMIGKGKLAKGGAATGVTGVKLSGQLSQIAKVVSLLGKDEDPFNVEGKKGMLTRLREKSNFISGALEWTSNLTGLFGAFYQDDARKLQTLKDAGDPQKIKLYNPLTGDRIPKVRIAIPWFGYLKNKKTKEFLLDENGNKIRAHKVLAKGPTKADPFMEFDYRLIPWSTSERLRYKNDLVPHANVTIDVWQLMASLCYIGSLTCQAMAPFTVRKLDMKEIYAHTAEALTRLPEDKRAGWLVKVIASLKNMKELPEAKNIPVAEMYAAVADDLYKHHKISLLLPAAAPGPQITAAEAPAVEKDAAAGIPAEKPEAPAAVTRREAAAKQGHDGASLLEKITRPAAAPALALMPA